MIYLKILILFPIFVFAVESDHLLLSRIVIAPDNAESISIINPTDESINLSEIRDSSALKIELPTNFGLSEILNLSENLVFNMSFKYSMDGGVTELPCYDDFRREYHCGTGLAWVDSQGFQKNYETSNSVGFSIIKLF